MNQTLDEPSFQKAQPNDALILWMPIFLMIGMGGYFVLNFEPAKIYLLSALCASIILTIVTIRWKDYLLWRWAVVGFFCITLGLFLAQLRTHQLSTPLIIERMWNAEIRGDIQSAERAGSGWRLVVNNALINQQIQNKYTLRLSVRKKDLDFRLGGRVQFIAQLMPASPPFLPGMFDFQRNAYFNGLSGFGYVTKIINYEPPSAQSKTPVLEKYREWLADHVYAVLQQPEAGIVTALLNGQRAGISRPITQSLQTSGLQHIISISGLHVGLLAAAVFFSTRLMLACSMRLALTIPIKKIAAFCALLTIIAYMFIVGLSPATVRSVIMSGIVLIAVMVDREAINLRLVALAAMLILLTQPESVLDIGFQLSFAAVTGLVAFFQMTQAFWQKQFWQESFIYKTIRALLMTVATSFIATLATAPLTMVYFQKIPVLSLLANVLATPLVGFLIMPGTFLAYIMTAFNVPFLSALPIQLMGWGVTGILRISDFVSSLPASVWHSNAPSFIAVILFMLALYQFLIAKNKVRLLALPILFLAILLQVIQEKSDIMMTQDRIILYPDPQSDILYFEGRMDRFQRDMLLQFNGKETVQPLPCQGMICDISINGSIIRIIRDVPSLLKACENAPKLLLTRYYLNNKCEGHRIFDRHILDKKGGMAISLKQDKTLEIETVFPHGTVRPWQYLPQPDNRYWKSKDSRIKLNEKGTINGTKTSTTR
jgi:competence protein ComEC